MMAAITVLIAEDDDLVRRALEHVLANTPDMTLVGAAGDAADAVRIAAAHRPMVALLDVRMPEGGPAAARGIRDVSPDTALVALSAYADQDIVNEMRALGASEFLVKGAVANVEIAAAIRRAAGRA
jgi:DNA-binding NarL/FixJ family response regulator